jgi:hypothetical protein
VDHISKFFLDDNFQMFIVTLCKFDNYVLCCMAWGYWCIYVGSNFKWHGELLHVQVSSHSSILELWVLLLIVKNQVDL